jgi:hypothetical protein
MSALAGVIAVKPDAISADATTTVIPNFPSFIPFPLRENLS